MPEIQNFREMLRGLDEKIAILENTPIGEIVFIDCSHRFNPPADLPSKKEICPWEFTSKEEYYKYWSKTEAERDKLEKIREQWDREKEIGILFHYNGIAGILGTALHGHDDYPSYGLDDSEVRELGILIEYKKIPDTDTKYEGRNLSPYRILHNFLSRKSRRFAFEENIYYDRMIELTWDSKLHIGKEAEQELKRYDAEFGNDFHVWTRADEIRGLKALGIL